MIFANQPDAERYERGAGTFASSQNFANFKESEEIHQSNASAASMCARYEIPAHSGSV